MKKLLNVMLVALLVLGAQSISMQKAKAMVVYDPSVEAQAILNVANTAQQIQMQLQNLSSMDAATAAENKQAIYSNLKQLTDLQNSMSGLVMNYSNFQNSFDAQYHDFSDYKGMSGEQYSQNAQQLLVSLNQSLYNAMSAQGLVAQNGNTSNQLQMLLDASQTADGALAAAQIGHQMAGLQSQQMMQLQQIMAQSNRAQSEWMALQTHKEAMAESLSEQMWERK